MLSCSLQQIDSTFEILSSYVPSQTWKRKISSAHQTMPQPEGCWDHLRPAERWHSHSNCLCSDVTSCKLHLKLPRLTHSSLCFIHRATTDPHGQQLPERESCACRPMVLSFGFCLITHS